MIKIFFQTMQQYDIKYKRFTVIYILLAAAAAVASILSIQATGNMTQAAELGITSDMVTFLVIVAVAGLTETLFRAIMALDDKRLFGRAAYSIRRAFAGRLLTMPYGDFANKNSGEGASLFTTDVPQAASFLTTQMLNQIAQITTILASIGFMLYINWWLTLAYFALFPIFAVMQAIIAAPIGKKREEASKLRAEYNNVVTDALQNPMTVLAYGLESSVERRFTSSYDKFYKADMSATRTAAGLALVGIFFTILPLFALFTTVAYLVIIGNMTIAEFIAMSMIASPVGNWLAMFSQELARLQTAKASVVRLADFVPEEIAAEAIRASIETKTAYAASFENVTFGYGDEKIVFDDVSFTINKGEITGIAGSSGSGKSTVLKLILGLYSTDNGEICISSDKLTYVPQDCHLMPVSIRDNITAGLPCDEEKLRRACEKAGIYGFIESLNDGFDSILVESAVNVSGGQKQRLAMARAFYRDADIILLDEATSALDPETEEAVLEAFQRYIKENNKTAIVVAHRKTVLDMSDKVISLDDLAKNSDTNSTSGSDAGAV